MFDLRYHVASLAAVFVALIVGILVGVGLAGSGVTKKADLQAARSSSATTRERDARRCTGAGGRAAEDAESVPARLSGGDARPLDGQAHRRPLRRLGRQRREPVDRRDAAGRGRRAGRRAWSRSPCPWTRRTSTTRCSSKGPKFVKYVGNDKLESLGNALGTEFAAGGQTPLWKVLGRQLISERTGNAKQPVDGVVVVRTAKPQQGDTMRFLRGLYSGLAAAGVPAVGVENSDTKLFGREGVPRPRALGGRRHRPDDRPRRARALLAGAPRGAVRRQATAPTRSCRRPREWLTRSTILVAARDEEERDRRDGRGAAALVPGRGGDRRRRRLARRDGGARRGGGRDRPPPAAARQGPGAVGRGARRAARARCCSSTPTCAAT